MQVTKRPSTLKRFQLSDFQTNQPIVVIEAVDEEHAIERSKLLTPEIPGIDDHDIFAIAEHPPAAPCVIPFFTDGYFQLIEAAGSTIH